MERLANVTLGLRSNSTVLSRMWRSDLYAEYIPSMISQFQVYPQLRGSLWDQRCSEILFHPAKAMLRSC
jgi:hypothetical protein